MCAAVNKSCSKRCEATSREESSETSSDHGALCVTRTRSYPEETYLRQTQDKKSYSVLIREVDATSLTIMNGNFLCNTANIASAAPRPPLDKLANFGLQAELFDYA